MSEYVLLVNGSVALMFLFAYMGFEMLNTRGSDGWDRALSLFMILISLIIGWTVAASNVEMAGILGAFTAEADGQYLAVIIAGWLIFGYFVFRLMFGVIMKLRGQSVDRRREEGGR